MKTKLSLLLSLSALLFISVPGYLLFYDAPEYIRITSQNNFYPSIFMGHYPMKPFFMAILWLSTHLMNTLGGVAWEYAGNLTAYILGLSSLVLFYRLSGYFFKDSQRLISTLIYSFFPAIWIINTNLLVESLVLPLFILSLNFLMEYIKSDKYIYTFGFLFGVILMLFSHVQTLLWLPLFIAFPLIFKKEIPNRKVGKLTLLTASGLVAYIVLQGIIFLFLKEPVIPSLIQLFAGRVGEVYNFSAIFVEALRAVRNMMVEVLRGFGSLTVFLSVWVLVKSKLTVKNRLALLIVFVPLFFLGGIWSGDFMVRRIVFLGVFLSLLMTRYFKDKAGWLVIYLVPMLIANILLNLRPDNLPLREVYNMQSKLPEGGLLISSHYLDPFIYPYIGEVAYVGEETETKIDRALTGGKRVFIDSQSVIAPYLLYVGNNLHLTSLSRFGNSDSKYLFEKYYFNLLAVQNIEKGIFIYELSDKPFYTQTVEGVKMGKTEPGKAVFVYSSRFSQRVRRERIDYADPVLWFWAILTNRKEPLYWTYGDKGGNYVLPFSEESDY